MSTTKIGTKKRASEPELAKSDKKKQILLDKEKVGHVEGYMQDYQVIAMIVLLGPKMQHVQNLVQDDVKRIMSEQLLHPSTTSSHQSESNSDYRMS